MADKTLFNQSLTVNQLAVTNSQFADVSGYVPSTASISCTKNSTSLAVSDFTTSVAVIGANTLNSQGIFTPLAQFQSPTSVEYNVQSSNDYLSVGALSPTVPAGIYLLNTGVDGVGMNCQNPNELTVNGSVVATQSVSANALTTTAGANSASLTCGGNNVVNVQTLGAINSINAPVINVVDAGNNVALNCLSQDVLIVGLGAGSVNANVYLGGLFGQIVNFGSPGLLITGQETHNVTFPFPAYSNASVYVYTFQTVSNNNSPCIVYSYSFVSQDTTNNTATLAISFDAFTANPSSLGFLNITGVNPAIY